MVSTGAHVVNRLIRDTLAPYPSDLVIVTKVGGRRDERGARGVKRAAQTGQAAAVAFAVPDSSAVVVAAAC